MHMLFKEEGRQPHIQENQQSIANRLLGNLRYLYFIKRGSSGMWNIFSIFVKRMRILNKLQTYKMIVLIHAIWHAIAALSLPSWQKEVRDITYQVVNAMKEAKKYETAV